jgi:LysM repeat protein
MGLAIMLKKLLSVSAGLLFALTVAAATVEWAANAPDRYVVRKGDTLWDISARFLAKPWQWPEIWQLNPQVRNPHLIYPGDELVLRGGHVAHGEGSIGPHVRATPLDDAIPPIPLSDIKQYLKHVRIISEEEFEYAPHVVGIEENQLRGSAGQLVYVRGLDAQPGDKLALLRLGAKYYDMPPDSEGRKDVFQRDLETPREDRPGMLWHYGPLLINSDYKHPWLGYEMREYGTLVVTRAGDPASALVTYSDFEVKAGDYVMPVEEAPYDAEYVPHAPDEVPDNMRILALSDAMNAVGPNQVVALSRGAADGVENGQVYSIYHEGETVSDRTDYPQGGFRELFHRKDSKVTLPPEFMGHVMVFRTFERVSYGLVMDAVKPVHLGDFLHDPDSTP